MFIIFGTKDSFGGGKNTQKTRVQLKHFSFYSFKRTERVEEDGQNTDTSSPSDVCALFQLGKVSSRRVSKPFQNKTRYCEASLIKKRDQLGKGGKKTFSVPWLDSPIVHI